MRGLIRRWTEWRERRSALGDVARYGADAAEVNRFKVRDKLAEARDVLELWG